MLNVKDFNNQIVLDNEPYSFCVLRRNVKDSKFCFRFTFQLKVLEFEGPSLLTYNLKVLELKLKGTSHLLPLVKYLFLYSRLFCNGFREQLKRLLILQPKKYSGGIKWNRINWIVLKSWKHLFIPCFRSKLPRTIHSETWNN